MRLLIKQNLLIADEYKKYGLGTMELVQMDTEKQVFTGVHRYSKIDEKIGLKR